MGTSDDGHDTSCLTSDIDGWRMYLCKGSHNQSNFLTKAVGGAPFAADRNYAMGIQEAKKQFLSLEYLGHFVPAGRLSQRCDSHSVAVFGRTDFG